MGRSHKVKYSNVGLPNNLLAAIGHVTALWAQLEYMIDLKITGILTLPGAPKIDPKLIQPFNDRLDLLSDLCKQFLTDPKGRKMTANITSDLKQLVGLRNLIVHGAVRHSKQRRKRRMVYLFRRICWDRQPRVKESRSMTVADVEAFAARLSDACSSATMYEVFFWTVERALLGKAG